MSAQAKKLIHQLGQTGNWRFKALLLAGLGSSPVTMRDVAEAWPAGRASDYRFLMNRRDVNVKHELERQMVVPKDSTDHHFLQTYAKDALTEHKEHELVSAPYDKAIKHALFAASTTEEVNTLFREELADTVAEGAQKRQVARQAAFVFNASTMKGALPVAQDRAHAYESAKGGIAEGAIIPDERENYTDVDWSCKKLGVGARITDEMVDHAFIDIIARQVSHVGETIENDINRIFLNNLLDNAASGNTFTAGANKGVPALNGGAGAVDTADFMPDTFVSHPNARTELFDDSNLVFVNRGGSDTELRERELDRVMGLTHHPMSGSTYDGTAQTWAYTGNDETGFVVYQRDAVWLVMHKDIEVKDYDDPIRDLQGVNARAWVDSVYAQPDAAARVIFSSA